jgi:hypothetical protein
MQFCKEHWDDLRAEIAKKGLDHLVAKSTEELNQRLLEEGTAAADPLLMAHQMIILAVVEDAGPAVMETDSCPLCMVKQDAGQELVTDWLDGCTTAVYNVYKEEGKLGEVQ